MAKFNEIEKKAQRLARVLSRDDYKTLEAYKAHLAQDRDRGEKSANVIALDFFGAAPVSRALYDACTAAYHVQVEQDDSERN